MRRSLFSRWELARRLRQEATPEERILWQQLRKNQLRGRHFRRQHVIAEFIVDFYCPSAALIIELDGAHHQDQLATDSQRDAILSGMGLRVLRFPNSQVCADLPGVLRRIESAIERGVPPSHLMGRGTGG